MWTAVLKVTALVVCALSLAPSYAHALEAPPRLKVWPPELWRDATVFHGQYVMFGRIGGAIDVAAVALTLAAAVVALRQARDVTPAIAGALLFAAGLIVWLSVVQPANGVMATWRPGPIPPEFLATQHRWETGHIVIAGLKLLGFVALSAWAVGKRAA